MADVGDGAAGVRFHDVTVDAARLTLAFDDGASVRLTRQERALLTTLCERPGQLFTRDELLAAVSAGAAEPLDRRIDFLVNRLRRKLRDPARSPRFLASQYGEGYVWIAAAAPAVPTDGRLLLISAIGARSDGLGETVLRPLHAALQARLTGGVQLASNLDTPAAFRFALDVSFYRAPQRLHAALVLRDGPSRTPAAAFHEPFGDDISPAVIERLATAIADAMWRHLAMGPGAPHAPTDAPLHLRMLDASALLDPPGVTWLANGEQLSRLREAHPRDPKVALMWAMHLFAKMTLRPGPDLLNRKSVAAVDDQIEQIVMQHLAAVRGDPVLALAAAKLLLLRRGSRVELAESLATEAFAGSAAFAAALPMLGQVHAFRGEFDEGQRLYDEGLQLCEPGSAFERYLLVLKCMAAVAADDHAAAARIFERLVELQPVLLEQMGLLFLPPGDDGLAIRLAPLADCIDLAHARRVIAYQWFRVADLFQQPAHAANAMRGPLSHLVRRLGPQVASEEIWSELPAELHYLRRSRRTSEARTS